MQKLGAPMPPKNPLILSKVIFKLPNKTEQSIVTQHIVQTESISDTPRSHPHIQIKLF